MKSANVDTDIFWSTSEILASLEISKSRLRDYCQILYELAPDEFDHRRYDKLYSPAAYKSLEELRDLFKQGFRKSQIEEKITKEGI